MEGFLAHLVHFALWSFFVIFAFAIVGVFAIIAWVRRLFGGGETPPVSRRFGS